MMRLDDEEVDMLACDLQYQYLWFLIDFVDQRCAKGLKVSPAVFAGYGGISRSLDGVDPGVWRSIAFEYYNWKVGGAM